MLNAQGSQADPTIAVGRYYDLGTTIHPEDFMCQHDFNTEKLRLGPFFG